jgi:hypothetical protein
MQSDVQKSLKEATEGLLYSSESDAPFEVVSWDVEEATITPERVPSLVGLKADTPVEETKLDDFFEDLVKDESWHDEADRKTIERYRSLQDIMVKQLSDVRVFRVGDVEIDIFIMGRTDQGTWEGIKTKAVET